MRLLITNDDGYDAEGLQNLIEVLSAEHDCFVVAPDQGRSCCGHSVTNATELEVIRKQDNHWTVSGTPADCVRIGLVVLGLKPDWVLSGVNHGGNLGIDTLYSGTVAAAREATILGFRSIALSQYMRRDISKNWKTTAQRAERVLGQLWEKPLAEGFFWNLNLPALEPEDASEIPIAYCPLELGPLPISYQADNPSDDSKNLVETTKHLYQSNYQARPRQEGSDVHLCFSGHAVVTRLQAFGFCPEGC